MSHKPGYISPNRPLNVRLHSTDRKEEFIALALAHRTTASELINQFVDWWMRVPEAELPARAEFDDRRLSAVDTHRRGVIIRKPG